METVTITAKILEKKKIEFFQTMESLKSLVKSFCSELDIKFSGDNDVLILIQFEGKEQMDRNFNNAEFNILKGTVKSLCRNISINFNYKTPAA